jgi:beta-barrel assembly-enhancing protease
MSGPGTSGPAPSIRGALRVGPLALAGSLAWPAVAAAFVLLSVSDEVAIGRKAQAAMRARTPVVSDPHAREYVSRIGHRLAVAARGPGFDYTFDVADYADLNALTLPGGHIWVYRGALAASTTESEAAGVLAHEVAHVELRHVARQISYAVMANMGLELLGALLGNTGGALTSRAAAGALTSSAFLGFSREDEREADREGTRILARAGWDPRGLSLFLQTARSSAGQKASAAGGFFSTHPSFDSRVASLRSEAASLPRGRRDDPAFADLKRRLSRLPPAGRAPRS